MTGRFKEGVEWEGLVPPDWRVDDMNASPGDHGIGVIDIGTVPGSDASVFGKEVMLSWRDEMFRRIRLHIERVQAHIDAGECHQCSSAANAAPAIVAFTGMRQFKFMFEKQPKYVVRCSDANATSLY